jgi:hypothetical protein
MFRYEERRFIAYEPLVGSAGLRENEREDECDDETASDHAGCGYPVYGFMGIIVGVMPLAQRVPAHRDIYR